MDKTLQGHCTCKHYFEGQCVRCGKDKPVDYGSMYGYAMTHSIPLPEKQYDNPPNLDS